MLKKNLRFPARLEAAALTGMGAVAPHRVHRRPFSSASSSRWRAVGVAALVLAMHAAVLYIVARTPKTAKPQLSVPLIVSFATAAEPMHAAPKAVLPKSKPKSPPVKPRSTALVPQSAPITNPDPAQIPAPDTVRASETASQEAPTPPAMSSPRFDAAYLNNPAPAYPSLSRRLGEEGRVLLRVFVDPRGRAREVHIHSASGHVRLDRAAQEAVARWRFVPARRGEDAVGAWVLVPISFTLKLS